MVDAEGHRVRLIHAENLAALGRLFLLGARVDLVYLDPPYNTGWTFEMADGRVAFEDRWASLSEYIDYLGERLRWLMKLLQPHGHLVIHVDPRVSHWIKVWADQEWGPDSFSAEVIWRYRRWPTPTRTFQRMHDVLLVYRKNPNVEGRWNQLYEPLAASTLKTHGPGRQQKTTGARGQRLTSTVETPSPGAFLSDVWDIGIIGPSSKERTGYPTQKPEALLERVILSLSNEDDVVLDPYCGSGTTLTVAQRLGRRPIGIDQSAVAIEIASKRTGLTACVLE